MKLSERMVLGLESTKPTKKQYYMARLKEWWNKVNPFNYRFFIYNKATLCDVHSAGKIGYDGKYLFLLNDDGKPWKVQHTITLIDAVNEPTMATVKLFVKLDEIIKIEK